MTKHHHDHVYQRGGRVVCVASPDRDPEHYGLLVALFVRQIVKLYKVDFRTVWYHAQYEAIIADLNDEEVMLFHDHPQYKQGTAELSKALKHAATLPNWSAARIHMRRWQDKYETAGAHDSVPREYINCRLDEFFPDESDDVKAALR